MLLLEQIFNSFSWISILGLWVFLFVLYLLIDKYFSLVSKEKEIILLSYWKKLLNQNEKNINENNTSKSSYSLIDKLFKNIELLKSFIEKKEEIKLFLTKLIESLNTYISLTYLKVVQLHFFTFWFKKSVELSL